MPDLSGSGLSGKQLANPEMFRPSSADLLGNHSSEPENIMTIPITKGKVLKFISHGISLSYKEHFQFSHTFLQNINKNRKKSDLCLKQKLI